MTRARCRRKPVRIMLVRQQQKPHQRALWDIERQSPSGKRWVWSKQKFILDIIAVFNEVRPRCFEGMLMTRGSLAAKGTLTESRDAQYQTAQRTSGCRENIKIGQKLQTR
eukprot:s2069_g4.t1